MPERLDWSAPEYGWRPFDIWLAAHDLDVDVLEAVTLNDDETVTATLFVVDAEGRPVLNHTRTDVRRVRRVFTPTSPPPRRLSADQ